jgi:hypothetical protein
VLYDSIIDVFETCNQPMTDRLHDAIRNGYISRRIFIDPTFEPIKTPKSNFDTREIQLQATHLSFLWNICYSMIGFQELTHKHANQETDVLKLHESPHFEQLALAVNWGISLHQTWRVWPDEIPTPDIIDERVQFTNELFLHAIRYLMYHEFAHLTLHSGSRDIAVKIKDKEQLNRDDTTRFRTMEFQADEYAFDCMFLTSDPQPQRYMKVLGAVIGYISSLYLPGCESMLNYHPRLEDRLKRIMKKADITEEPYKTYLHLTITMGLQLHLTLRHIDYLSLLSPKGPYENVEDLEEALFAILT